MKARRALGLAVLACAGLASAFGLATPTGADTGTSTTATGSTSTSSEPGKHGRKAEKPGARTGQTCRPVLLAGSDGSGSVTFTVTRAGRNDSTLVGKQVTLNVPSGSTLAALACSDGSGALTLRQLRVARAPAAARRS